MLIKTSILAFFFGMMLSNLSALKALRPVLARGRSSVASASQLLHVQPRRQQENGAPRGRHFSAGALAAASATAFALSMSSSSSSACSGGGEGSSGGDKFQGTALYPALAPYEKATLKVSPVHTIAYSQYGNPNGKPVLFVHGGPGGGTDPAMARFFDPKAYRIILVDQRGCGESTPFASLEDNTTYDSVRDFEQLRRALGVDRWQVFGGSWGSTLSLAYAVEHPERVTELVLRGIFLIRDKGEAAVRHCPHCTACLPSDNSPHHTPSRLYSKHPPPQRSSGFTRAPGLASCSPRTGHTTRRPSPRRSAATTSRSALLLLSLYPSIRSD